MFTSTFQAELAYLRDTGSAFAAAHPELATTLGVAGSDPDVDRLLEGVAFMTARLHEQSENATAPGWEQLCARLAPQLTAGMPACSVVRFTPDPDVLREPFLIPRHTPMAARPVPAPGTDGDITGAARHSRLGAAVPSARGATWDRAPAKASVRCRFRTTRDLTLLPIQLEKAQLQDAGAGFYRLQLDLSCAENGLPSVCAPGQTLRLFLGGGELEMGALLRLWFSRYCQAVRFLRHEKREPGAGCGDSLQGSAASPDDCIAAVGFDDDDALLHLPGPSRHQLATWPARMQELLAFPQKFLFVDICGLDRWRDQATPRFSLQFDFVDAPSPPRGLRTRDIQLHSVPVTNLFASDGEPVVYKPTQAPPHLVADSFGSLGAEVVAVEALTSVDEHTGKRAQLIAASECLGDEETYYLLRRRHSPLDGGVDTSVVLREPQHLAQAVLDGRGRILSSRLLCSNRGLTKHLDTGSICEPVVGTPSLASFSNVTPVTAPIPAPQGASALRWLAALLGSGGAQGPWATPNNLAAVVQALGAATIVGHSQQRRHANLAKGFCGSFWRGRTIRHAGAWLPARHWELSLVAERFAGPGEAALWAELLHRGARSTLPLHTPLQTTASLPSTGHAWTWRSL